MIRADTLLHCTVMAPDFSCAEQEGIGYFLLTTRYGRRCCTAATFPNPARKRPNLEIVTQALFKRVVDEDGHADGVVFLDGSDQEQRVNSTREVVLSSGALGSPIS